LRICSGVYINDTTSLTVNLPKTDNTNRLEAAILLVIKVAARPDDKQEPIPHKPVIVKDKLAAEGGLVETKIILGWHFNFRKLTVILQEHNHIAWFTKIQ
jgi:hypothetical protein